MKKTRGTVSTYYLEGMWEEDSTGAVRKYYTLAGQVVAMRAVTSSANTVSYLQGDSLGSVSPTTTASGAAGAPQEFDPWGKVRSGSITATRRNYTGQYLDDTGLLFYNARYYDATIGRFISADTIVPGNASGGMDGIAVKPLTVDFHEGGFQTKLNQENGLGFWFQLSGQERRQAGSPWGSANAQALNRYSYVQNNPLKWTDPTGHATCDTGAGCGGVAVNNTNHSIWVIGSVIGACPDGSGNGVVCDNVLVELAPGQSSVDAGMADVDAVVIHFNPDGTVEGYKLTSSEKATLFEDEKGNIIISFEAKEPWLAPVVGAERKLRDITDINSRKTTWGYNFVQTSSGKIFPVRKKSAPKRDEP